MTPLTSQPVYFLLVDDLEENLLSLEALLRHEGLILLKAKSGNEALELLLKYDIALALIDVQMPGMDGFELAELMRGIERTRRVPIIFLTAGSTDTQRRFRGYEAGAVDFLNKPIESDILRSKTEVFFELYRQRQQVSQLLDESRQYASALREADLRKDEFLAMLAHELRNPLAPIRNGLEIMRMSRNTNEVVEVQDMMDRQLNHLVRLIDDLLDVSRVGQGKIELRREAISLQKAIHMAIETCKPLIDAKKHTLRQFVPKEPIWVYADMTRLAQMIGNLLNNAAKYTPDNGTVTVTVSCDANLVSLSIMDNGFGIRSDMLSKIFDLFTQADSNIERTQGGLGIGLALVKKLAGMHEGSVYAQSDGPGQGSVFTLHLPLTKAPEKVVEQQIPPATPASTLRLRVLIVDDNVASAKTTGWMLEMIGHEQHLAFDGQQALEAAKEIQPDVIMLDIGLPGMNGYEVCRELRKDPRFKDTVFIAQTGWGQERDRRQAFEAGFNHHLIKPVNFNEFSSLLISLQTAKQSLQDNNSKEPAKDDSGITCEVECMH